MINVKSTESKKKNKTGIASVGLTPVIELLPYKRLEGNFIVDRDDHYQAYLKIGTRNVFSLSWAEKTQLMNHLTTLVRLYADDLSILSLMFPAGTEPQQVFWNRKLMQARKERNHVQIKSCQEQIGRMLWVEKNLANLEFFLILYADNKQMMSDKVRDIKRNGGFNLEISDVGQEKIEKVLFKLNNMNTDI